MLADNNAKAPRKSTEGSFSLRHGKIIRQMTLEEKASLMSGANFWNTKAIEHLGIPSIMLTDGPHGLRKQGGKADHLGLNKSLPATCFPTAATLANSWDVGLLEEVGQCLGKEAALESVSVLLGPGLNIKRNPLCGRNFEYFSEDPYLSGKLAAAMTQGIQKEGVSACPKHFAVNSQENHRMIVDEIVDERALHELYLEAFRYVVQEAKPLTLMTSYNRVNGEYANEHRHLLQDILVKDWGYEGAVVSDWGGNNDRVTGLKAGSTLEMPSANGMTDKEIVAAIQVGVLDERVLNKQVDKLLCLIEATTPGGLSGKKEPKKESKAQANRDLLKKEAHEKHHEKAIEAACRSIVLLKNDEQTLPLVDKKLKIAVIGDFAEKPRYQGAGSSLIVPSKLTSLNQALKAASVNVIGYEPGFKRYGQKHNGLLKRAVALAKQADVVLLFLGLDEGSETEGVDRKHMSLSENQLRLVNELTEIPTRIVLIMAGGSPVEMPFADKVQSILHGYLPGQGGGEALVRTLLGMNNPSGKLAESYPIKYEDVASAGYYPGEQLTSEHRESIFIGYRQYDLEERPVLFPFGYGLSYTRFEYQELKIQSKDPKSMTVKVTIANVGDLEGDEIIQVYVAPKERKAFHEKKGLKAFTKISIRPGESCEVLLELSQHAFAYYHIGKKRWVIEEGYYEVLVGSSSRDLPLKEIIYMEGEKAEDPYETYEIGAYQQGCIDELLPRDFEGLLGRSLPSSGWDKEKILDRQDIIEQARYGSWFGRLIYRLIFLVHHWYKWRGKPLIANNVLFALGMPFRSVARMSGGKVNMTRLDGLLAMVNGHFFKGLWQFISSREPKDRYINLDNRAK